jgi:hypothetical protein
VIQWTNLPAEEEAAGASGEDDPWEGDEELSMLNLEEWC